MTVFLRPLLAVLICTALFPPAPATATPLSIISEVYRFEGRALRFFDNDVDPGFALPNITGPTDASDPVPVADPVSMTFRFDYLAPLGESLPWLGSPVIHRELLGFSMRTAAVPGITEVRSFTEDDLDGGFRVSIDQFTFPDPITGVRPIRFQTRFTVTQDDVSHRIWLLVPDIAEDQLVFGAEERGGFLEVEIGSLTPNDAPAYIRRSTRFLARQSDGTLVDPWDLELISRTDLGPAPVPLPAGGWLLGAALGGLALFRRRAAGWPLW